MGAVDNATFAALQKAAQEFGKGQELTVFGSFGTDLVTFANRHMLVTAAREGRINLSALMASYGRGGEALVLGRIIPDMGKVGGPFSDKGDFDFAVYRGRDNSLPGNEAVVWSKDQQIAQAATVKKFLPADKQNLPADFDYAKYENEVLRGFDTSYRGRARFGFDETTKQYQFLGRVQSVLYGEGGAVLRDFPEFFQRTVIPQAAQTSISSRFNVENLERIGWWTAGIPYFWNDLAQRSQSTNQWFRSGDLADYGSLANLYLRGVGTFLGAFTGLIGNVYASASSALSYTASAFASQLPSSFGGYSPVPVPPQLPPGIGLASIDPISSSPAPNRPAVATPSSLGTATSPTAQATSLGVTLEAGSLGFAELTDAVLVDLPFATPSLLNGSFDAVSPGGRPTDWQSFGSVTVINGRAVLTESAGRLYSNLSQTFIVPAGARRLTLTLTVDGLNPTPGQPGDAFEVALLNAQTGRSLVGTARDLTQTDALLNIQANGSRALASTASVTGTDGSSLNLSIDLTGVDAGTAATLYLDLISFGAAGSSISIDDVRIVSGPSLTVGLDPSTDSGALGDNLTNVSPILLVGTTQPLQAVTLDLDGDGFDDGSATADDQGRFQFRGILLRDGENPIRLQATNADGSALLETVIVLDRTAPRFVIAEINHGAAQRSMVTSLVLRFSEDISDAFESSDIVLRNFTAGIDVEASLIYTTVPSERSILLSFPDLTGGSLADGNYLLTLRNAGITDAAGNRLEGDVQVAFFRYFGDSDGDRDVDYLDAFRLRDVLRNIGSTAASLEIFDRNADATLGADDLSAFQIRQLTFLPPLPLGTRLEAEPTAPINTPGKLAERRGNPSLAPTVRSAAAPGLLRRMEPLKPILPGAIVKPLEFRRSGFASLRNIVAPTTPPALRLGPIAVAHHRPAISATPTETPLSRADGFALPLARSEPGRPTTSDADRPSPTVPTAARLAGSRPMSPILAVGFSRRSEPSPRSEGMDGEAPSLGRSAEPARDRRPIVSSVATASSTPLARHLPQSPASALPALNGAKPVVESERLASKPSETRPSTQSAASKQGLHTLPSSDMLLRQLSWEAILSTHAARPLNFQRPSQPPLDCCDP
jgi:hypothetical protein